MSSFDQAPTYFHSFLVEGLPSAELIAFAKSIKADQVARGASHCLVSLIESDGTDRLEAKNIFPDLDSRDAYVSSLSPPNHAALADMGLRISTQIGYIVSNSLTPSSATSSSQHEQNRALPSSSPAGTGKAQPNKSSWPELKNTPSAEAVRIISEHRPDAKVMLVPQGAMVTMDMRMDRVRVFHNESTGMVTTIPRIG